MTKVYVTGPIYTQFSDTQCILHAQTLRFASASSLQARVYILSVAHQRESGILTGAGGSPLQSWSSDNRVFQLEPSWSPESGILPEPAARAGFGNRVFYRSRSSGNWVFEDLGSGSMLAGTRFSIWNQVEPGTRRNRPSLLYICSMFSLYCHGLELFNTNYCAVFTL